MKGYKLKTESNTGTTNDGMADLIKAIQDLRDVEAKYHALYDIPFRLAAEELAAEEKSRLKSESQIDDKEIN